MDLINASGVGDVPLLTVPKPTITTLPTVPTATQPVAAPVKTSVWDSINKALNVGQQATNIYSTIKTSSSSGGSSNSSNPGIVPGPAPDSAPKSNTTKIVLITTGVAAAIGTVVFLIAQSRKKRKSLSGVTERKERSPKRKRK